MTQSRKNRRIVLQGIGASRGQALGRTERLVAQQFHVPAEPVAPAAVPAEIRRVRAALRRARAALRQVREGLGQDDSDPATQILASHEMILQDRELTREITAAIKTERMNAAQATRSVLWAKASYFEALPSELFRSRAADIRDVERRLLGQLLGSDSSPVGQLPPGSVVVAGELTPGDTLALAPDRIAAFITEHGTVTSHVTILARSRGVPAVIGVAEAGSRIPAGALVLVDGDSGRVIVWPDERDLGAFRAQQEREARLGILIDERLRRPGATRDGRPVPIEVNIDRADAAAGAVGGGAEGIGLFRTEFLFLGSETIPDEEAQVQAYRRVLVDCPGLPVTVRTLDLGGDKTSALFGIPQEANPFLGLRGIRLSLQQPEVFRVQARALLRAACHGDLRILLPMISSVTEVRRARELMAEAALRLQGESAATPQRVPIGVMIEVPAAVTMSDVLAREADFFSIGSNDLTQYLLAVDRGNDRIAPLYDPLDPAVLRAIEHCVRQAHAGRIEVSCCGEMASDTLGALLLVGLDVDRLSVAPLQVGRTKAMLREVRAADLQRLAQRCIASDSAEEVRRRVREELAAYPQFRLEEQAGRMVGHWSPEV